ncbi:hypothetical protein CYMTET_8673 [Cymbomonas tetramitiformis]|uniref:Uncharacterized protein n=1 Tax=Cymbomonas tetramitiformis TaxID=36881 RepID=A0AAE0GUF8_9CHLO|nr:hypothetical protein CYMTET_8673 [Cymbomonas tetramitiformis]
MYNPVTPQALAIVNGEFDLPGVLDRKVYHQNVFNKDSKVPYYESTGDNNELFSMTKHDLCFREARSVSARNRPIALNDNWLKVFSSFNQLPMWVSGETWQENDNIVFVGISQTQMMMDRAKTQSAGVAVAIAGKLSVINSGMHIIQPGDTVCWDFPNEGNINKMTNGSARRKRAKYNDGNRIVASVVPLHRLTKTFEKHYQSMRIKHGDKLRSMGGDLGFQHPSIYAHKRAVERIIGKAVTRAQPDEP